MSTKPSALIFELPTEAGTHFPGQCLAPDRILNGLKRDDDSTSEGLFAKLESIGWSVSRGRDLLSHLPLSITSWQPSRKVNGARNETNTLRVMNSIRNGLRALAFETPESHFQNEFLIFLGGDCSITPAILTGLHDLFQVEDGWDISGEKYPRIGILYMDGDVDLTLPVDAQNQESATCIMDSMVLTHLTQRPGGLDSMKAFSAPNGEPLINPSNIVLFGFDPLQPSPEHWTYLLENQFKAFSRPSVAASPAVVAKSALKFLEERCDIIILHFDVDVIDSAEFPLANYPHYAGLRGEQAFEAMKLFLSSEKVKGMVLTEVNPNNDPEGWMCEQVVDAIASGLEERQNQKVVEFR